MLQVDLVPACAGGSGDRKIACETLADGRKEEESRKDGSLAGEDDGECPPASFWLSKDAEYDWFDRNAFYERKDSAKGNSNSTNLNPQNHPNSIHNSQRFLVNLKSKASIIGLPKTQNNPFVDSNRRTSKPSSIRLFPKRSASAGKSTVAVPEPCSPKVSCMGRVRSKRGRRRSNSSKRCEKLSEKSKTAAEKPKPKSSGDTKKKGGLYSKVMSMFRSKKSPVKSNQLGGRELGEAPEEPPAAADPAPQPQRKSLSVKPVNEPPSLGGMKRFASGRQSGSWTAEDFSRMASGSPAATGRF